MKSLLLSLFSLLYFQSHTAFAQRSNVPNMLQLTIKEYGLAKSSSNSRTSYDIQNYKLNYNFNFNGSMGIKHADENAKKKFTHRLQREVYRFLDEAGTSLKNKKLDFEKGDSDIVIDISLSYVYNGEKTTWSIKGGQGIVEKHTDYKKILELEALIRELSNLGEKGF